MADHVRCLRLKQTVYCTISFHYFFPSVFQWFCGELMPHFTMEESMKTTSASLHSGERRIVPLGKAREQTRAVNNEAFPELVGDKTQRIGG